MRALALLAVLVPSLAGAQELVDLLRAGPAQVAVSSRVRNVTDKPEHLVDGNLETAWSSRTGDLAGAWIAFRIPPDAQLALLPA